MVVTHNFLTIQKIIFVISRDTIKVCPNTKFDQNVPIPWIIMYGPNLVLEGRLPKQFKHKFCTPT